MRTRLTLWYSTKLLFLVHILIVVVSTASCASQNEDDNKFIERLLKVAEVEDVSLQLSQLEGLYKTANKRQEYFILPTLAKVAVEAGAYEQAELYANNLLEYAMLYCCDWNYGNAIHDGNTVKGMVALERGDIQEASKRLLESSRAPNSPQLATFGPDMMLAEELLKHGETKYVLKYLANIKGLWSKGSKRIDKWISQINEGEQPSLDKW
jgi:hypothetical protein